MEPLPEQVQHVQEHIRSQAKEMNPVCAKYLDILLLWNKTSVKYVEESANHARMVGFCYTPSISVSKSSFLFILVVAWAEPH